MGKNGEFFLNVSVLQRCPSAHVLKHLPQTPSLCVEPTSKVGRVQAGWEHAQRKGFPQSPRGRMTSAPCSPTAHQSLVSSLFAAPSGGDLCSDTGPEPWLPIHCWASRPGPGAAAGPGLPFPPIATSSAAPASQPAARSTALCPVLRRAGARAPPGPPCPVPPDDSSLPPQRSSSIFPRAPEPSVLACPPPRPTCALRGAVGTRAYPLGWWLGCLSSVPEAPVCFILEVHCRVLHRV